MPQSASGEFLLGAVEAAVREMELLCGRAERALMLRRWEDLNETITDARRVTHALQNAMEDARDVRDAQFDEGIMRRIRYVGAIRENQMTRLQQYHDAVGQRLALVARWKSALKSLQHGRAPRLSALDSMR